MARNKWIKIRTNDGKGVRYVRSDRYEAWKQEHLNDTYGSAARTHFIGGEGDKGSSKWNFEEADAMYNGGAGGKANGFLDFFSNMFTKWSGSGMTDAEKEAADYNTQVGRENMQLEKQLQLELFNETQSYGAQVKQMQAAGLNPAMMMSNGVSQSVPSGPSAQAGTASASPSGEFPNILGLVQTIMGASQLKSENALRKSQALKNEADAGLSKAETIKRGIESDILEVDRLYSNIRNQIYTAKGLSEIQNNIKDLEIKDGVIKIQGTEIQLNEKELQVKDANILVAQADAALKNLEAEKARTLLPYAVEYLKADIALKNSTSELNNASAIKAHADALVSFTEAAIKQGLFEGGYVEKFLSKMDADTFSSIGSGIRGLADASTADSKIAANEAIARNQSAQASYTEEQQEYLAADKIVGYLATGVSAICDISNAQNNAKNGESGRRNDSIGTATGLLSLLLRMKK